MRNAEGRIELSYSARGECSDREPMEIIVAIAFTPTLPHFPMGDAYAYPERRSTCLSLCALRFRKDANLDTLADPAFGPISSGATVSGFRGINCRIPGSGFMASANLIRCCQPHHSVVKERRKLCEVFLVLPPLFPHTLSGQWGLLLFHLPFVAGSRHSVKANFPARGATRRPKNKDQGFDIESVAQFHIATFECKFLCVAFEGRVHVDVPKMETGIKRVVSAEGFPTLAFPIRSVLSASRLTTCRIITRGNWQRWNMVAIRCS
ncbi:hypothetical protein BCR34DRAFT_304811 [Clohesyomyces aquaticus]|uniref:Uncharacterized protein n=1 Tax=Clohesyomyces aquaticus TaxID=1231657 RepID=A0A1Y1ZQW8_9PLEO|nr:hypothetical protein BCR34DRAFT_304811 [Clohesyomyces aquaticus]